MRTKEEKIEALASCHMDRIEMGQESILDLLKKIYKDYDHDDLEGEYAFYFGGEE